MCVHFILTCMNELGCIPYVLSHSPYMIGGLISTKVVKIEDSFEFSFLFPCALLA